MEWLKYTIEETLTGRYIFNPNSKHPTSFTKYEYDLLKQVSEIELEVLSDYILDQISPWTRTTFNPGMDSYRLKHRAENAVGFYVPEVLFRVAMRVCKMDEKIIIQHTNHTHAIYRISSNLLQEQKNSMYEIPPTLLAELQNCPNYAPKSYISR